MQKKKKKKKDEQNRIVAEKLRAQTSLTCTGGTWSVAEYEV